MPGWTTRDGYRLVTMANLGRARALIHGAGMHGRLRALFRGDLRRAAFDAIGSLAMRARRVRMHDSPQASQVYLYFSVRAPERNYLIVGRALRGNMSGSVEIVGIRPIGHVAVQPVRSMPEGEALYMTGTGYARPPREPVSPGNLAAGDFSGAHGTTIRTEGSERARHRDLLAGTQGHHAFPKYLGGQYRQTLVNLPSDLHYLYHQELDRILKLPRLRGKIAYDTLSVGQTIGILKRLMKHAREFDKQHKTAILPGLKAGIKAAKPLAGRRLSSEPPRPRTRPARLSRPAVRKR